MKKVIVCTHSGSYMSYKNHWENSGLEFDWLVDTTNGYLQPEWPSLLYDEQQIRQGLQFKGNVSKKHYWNSYGNRNIIWFYPHFRMIRYFADNPNYDYYWFMDDDVTGNNWNLFFDSLESNKADFISMYGFKKQTVKTQPSVPYIDKKTTSGPDWFERFPGDGDKMPEGTKDLFGSFFPIVRISNRALRKLVDLNAKGFSGYSEGYVPTILNSSGMILDTLFDNRSNAKYHDDSKVNLLHKNTKITWKWI